MPLGVRLRLHGIAAEEPWHMTTAPSAMCLLEALMQEKNSLLLIEAGGRERAGPGPNRAMQAYEAARRRGNPKHT